MGSILVNNDGNTSVVEYDRSAKQWQVWQGDKEQALVVGGVVAYPASIEGKRAAMLSALTRDCPAVAAWVEALMQAHPENWALHNRLLRAGFIIRDGLIKDFRLEEHGFIYARIRSQSQNPHLGAREYTVTYNIVLQCDCHDFEDGRAHRAGYYRATYAPHVPRLGIACKHGLAAWIAAKLTPPMATCPECNGSGIGGYASVDVPGSLKRPEACELCAGRGKVPQEWVADLMVGNQPIPQDESEIPFDGRPVARVDPGEPMSYEDRPLSDDEQADLEALRRRDDDLPI